MTLRLIQGQQHVPGQNVQVNLAPSFFSLPQIADESPPSKFSPGEKK